MCDEDDVESAYLHAAYRYHADMLHDGVRNSAYRAGIRKWARVHAPAAGAPGICMDVGCGSGLLVRTFPVCCLCVSSSDVDLHRGDQGLLVAQASAAMPIVSVEVVSHLAHIAATTFRANEIPCKVPQDFVSDRPPRATVLHTHSTALDRSALPHPLRLVVAELLDTGLLGEGVLPTMRHIATHLATPGTAWHAIPCGATVYAQVSWLACAHISYVGTSIELCTIAGD